MGSGVVGKGSYIGQDGRTYRVNAIDVDPIKEKDEPVPYVHPDHPDWPAAKAALDELIAEEAEEWVEWEAGPHKMRFRCRPDGSEFQGMADKCYEVWGDFEGGWSQAAFRAGLAQGRNEAIDTDLAERSKLYEDGYEHGKRVRDENMRALVEAVLDSPVINSLNAVAVASWTATIRDLARKVVLAAPGEKGGLANSER